MVNLGSVVADRYHIIRQLGTTSLVNSYLANDLSFGNIVVVRTPREQTELAFYSLENEAMLLTNVTQENVAKLIDFGNLGNNFPYLILEWVPGITVEEHLANNTFSVPQCLEVATAIAKALEAIHNAGYVHRDIKPANIILPQDDRNLSFSKATLIDFGSIGKLETLTKTTKPGEMFGTPYYMSPEQLLALPQSPSADIYGIGALLYEMLYQRPPFIGKNPLDVFEKILKQDVIYPNAPNSEPELFKFIKCCLAKIPENRPRRASELVSELKELRRIYSESPLGNKNLARNGSSHLQHQMTGGISVELVGIIAGLAIAFSGLGGGLALHNWLGNMQPDSAKKVTEFNAEAKSREFLTQTLEERFDQIITQNDDAFGQALEITLELIFKEYREGKTSNDRVGALQAAIATAEKLERYNSPWYVRYEKVIATIVSILGVAVGLSGVILGAMKLRSK